jgi:predicted transcriptional regulator
MLDNITFVDLVALTRIAPDSTVERFGGLINSSFFDASNILGTLKQKGLVDFITQFPSQSAITITESGKQLITEVQQKATTPFDKLDMEILMKISDGNKTLADLTAGVNVTPKDMAIHLYKLSTQQFISYELRNGNMNLTLTEKGFLSVKEGAPRPEAKPQTDTATQQTATDTAVPNILPESGGTLLDQPDIQKYAPPKTDEELKALETKILKEKQMDRFILAAIIIVIAIVVFYLYIIGAI